MEKIDYWTIDQSINRSIDYSEKLKKYLILTIIIIYLL